MRGKNGTRPRGLSIGSENMCLFSDDPLMQGLALFGNGGLLLSHTPPNFTPGSYEVSHMKRARAGSISGRLRSASDLEEKGLIDKSQKGVLKDLIISGDAELQAALDLYESGDDSQLQALMERGMLDRRDSLDLLQDLDLDFGIMDLAVPNDGAGVSTGSSDGGAQHLGPTWPSDVVTGVLEEDLVVDETGGVMRRNSTKSGGAGGEETFAEAALAGAGGGAKARMSPLRREDGAGVAGNSFAEGGGGGDPVGTHGHPQHMEPQHQQSIDCGDESEHEIDLGGDSTCQFDIGDMAFDTAFEHDYASHHEDDVGMKEQVTVECASPPSTAKEVGPLPVVANSKLPIHLVPSGADDVDDEGHHRTRGGSGTGGLDGVMTGPGEDGGHEHGGADGDVDGDSPELGSFGTMAAVIGDFSPQFKFSFTEDIHLDLGGGLKDELRDLESFSDPLPDHPGKGGDILGIGMRAQQLLSRGGPSVKLDDSLTVAPCLGSGSGSACSDVFSPNTARMSPDTATDYYKAAKEEEAGNNDNGGAAETPVVVGFTSNHYSSGAAYSMRRTGSYGTTTRSAAGAERAAAGLRSQNSQVRGAYGRESATVASGQRYESGGGSSTPHHAARGRPVVSGMEIMVGNGPKTGLSMVGSGVDGEQKKFVGAYSPEARRQRVQRFLQKREHRVWTKMVKYDVRKNFADTRMRVKGRFVKKEDEALLREVMACA